MANIECVGRTGYFRVTDEEKWSRLLSDINDVFTISHFTQEIDCKLHHAIGAYDGIDFDWFEENKGYDFLKEIQSILPEGEAFVYMESEHEKLRYIISCAVIVTKDERRWLDFETKIINECENMGCTAPLLSY